MSSYVAQMMFQRAEAEALAPALEAYHAAIQQYLPFNKEAILQDYTIEQLEAMLEEKKLAASPAAEDPDPEPEELIEFIEDLVEDATDGYRKTIQNQRHELARLNQKLADVRLGQEAAWLVQALRRAADIAGNTQLKYRQNYNEALASLAAILANIDDNRRFDQAVADRYADVVAAMQSTKDNLEKTLEALQHILKVSERWSA